MRAGEAGGPREGPREPDFWSTGRHMMNAGQDPSFKWPSLGLPEYWTSGRRQRYRCEIAYQSGERSRARFAQSRSGVGEILVRND